MATTKRLDLQMLDWRQQRQRLIFLSTCRTYLGNCTTRSNFGVNARSPSATANVATNTTNKDKRRFMVWFVVVVSIKRIKTMSMAE